MCGWHSRDTQRNSYRKGLTTMVSSIQRLYWLAVVIPLALGPPLLANAGMINTQLLDTNTVFANTIFDKAFTDSATAGCGRECAIDSKLSSLMQSRLGCVWPHTEEESSNIVPGVHAGGDMLGSFLRVDVGLVLLVDRSGNLTDPMISICNGLVERLVKESRDHCYSLDLESSDFTVEPGLPLSFPQAAKIEPKNYPLNSLSFSENQLASFAYLPTSRVKLGLHAIATICQQRGDWSTYQSGSDSSAWYQRLAITQTSAGNGNITDSQQCHYVFSNLHIS